MLRVGAVGSRFIFLHVLDRIIIRITLGPIKSFCDGLFQLCRGSTKRLICFGPDLISILCFSLTPDLTGPLSGGFGNSLFLIGLACLPSGLFSRV